MRLVKGDGLEILFGPAVVVHGHFRLENLIALFNLRQHPLGGEEAEGFAKAGQEAILHIRVFKDLEDQHVADILVYAMVAAEIQVVAHAIAVGEVQAVVHIIQNPFPLAARHLVVANVARIGVGEEAFQNHVVKIIVHIHIIQDVLQILRVLAGGKGFYLVDKSFPFGVGAVVDLGGLGAVAFQHVDGLGLIHAQPFVLGDKVLTYALAQVVVAPVLTVDVYDHWPPCLMDDRGIPLIDQTALHAVHHARPHAVVAAVAQHEGAVLVIIPIREQTAVDVLAAIARLGCYLEGFLWHIQAVLADQAEFHALAEHGFACIHLKHLSIGADAHLVFLLNAVQRGGVFEGNCLIALQVDALACGEDARLLVPQPIRIGNQAHDRQSEIGLEHVGGRYGFGGLQARFKGARAHGGGGVQGEGAGVHRAVADGGNGAVQRVAHGSARRHGDGYGYVFGIQAAGQLQRGGLREAQEARAVGAAGRGRVIIKKTARSQGAPVAVIGGNKGQIQLIQHIAAGVGQGNGFPARARKLAGGVQRAAGGNGIFAVEHNDLVFARPDDRALRELPLAGPVDVVRQAPAAQIHRVGAGVVDFHPVLIGFTRHGLDIIVGGHYLADIHLGCVERAQIFIRARDAVGVVGFARRGQGVHLPGAGGVVAAIAAVHSQVIKLYAVNQLPQGVGQRDRFALGGQAEIGVRIARLAAVAVLA